jgi:hypothetical protein
MPSNFKKLVRERMAKTGESWQTAERHVRVRKAPEPDAGGQRETTDRTGDNSGLELVNEAHETRAAFYKRLQTAHVAGEAYKAFRDPALFTAAMNGYEELAEIEARAVKAYQHAFGRPTRAEMLREACNEAQFPFEYADLDPDHWELWAERVYRAAYPPAGSRGRELLQHACRYARSERFLTAAQMLRIFVEFVSTAALPGRVTVFATKPRLRPEREPVCAVMYVYGRPTARSPFGRKGVSTLCGAHVWSSAIDYVSLTDDVANVTCPKCKAVLHNGGFPTGPGSGMCSDCDRYPSEGHLPTCRTVTVYGMKSGSGQAPAGVDELAPDAHPGPRDSSPGRPDGGP